MDPQIIAAIIAALGAIVAAGIAFTANNRSKQNSIDNGNSEVYNITVADGYSPDKSLPTGLNDAKFTTEKAMQFYDASANHYDNSNSSWLQETHSKVSNVIRNHLSNKRTDVLDLGGGTGKMIPYNLQENNSSSINLIPNIISWTNYDASINMLEVFKKNMNEENVICKTIHGNLLNIREKIPNKKYDIVVMSYVLSSLPELPDFKTIAEFMHEGSCLIIADSDPIYTIKNGCEYKIVTDVQRNILNIQPINPIEIISKLQKYGVFVDYTISIKKLVPGYIDEVEYSFILVFKKKVNN